MTLNLQLTEDIYRIKLLNLSNMQTKQFWCYNIVASL